jgi:hypothetical protein
MSVQNLGIVFGPTLMGSPTVNGPNPTFTPQNISSPIPQNDGVGLNDMGWQCKVVEIILTKYHSIFVME